MRENLNTSFEKSQGAIIDIAVKNSCLSLMKYSKQYTYIEEYAFGLCLNCFRIDSTFGCTNRL